MRKPFCSIQLIGILLILALIIRIVLFFLYQPYVHPERLIGADAIGYHSMAMSIIDHGCFKTEQPGLEWVDALRTPVYPLFIAFFYLIFGVNAGYVLLMQQLLAVASVFLLYRIGTLLFSKKTGLIAAAFLAIDPTYLHYTFDVYTESLFVFILLLTVFFFVRYLKEQKKMLLILSALLLGITTLTRPIAEFLPIVGLGILVIQAIKMRQRWQTTTIHAALFLVVFTATISPWLIRNKIVYDHYALTSVGAHNLLYYNVVFAIEQTTGKPFEAVRQDITRQVEQRTDRAKADNPFYIAGVKQQLALEYIKSHPVAYTVANLTGMFNMYTSIGYKNFLSRFCGVTDFYKQAPRESDCGKIALSGNRLFGMKPAYLAVGLSYAAELLALYASVVLSVILLFKQRRYLVLVSLSVIILYFTAVTGLVGADRFRLAFTPYLILLASFSLGYYYSKIKRSYFTKN
jgi:4-amino-4-deoxy-L-arabinose transferase-like glycosyltransferase